MKDKALLRAIELFLDICEKNDVAAVICAEMFGVAGRKQKKKKKKKKKTKLVPVAVEGERTKEEVKEQLKEGMQKTVQWMDKKSYEYVLGWNHSKQQRSPQTLKTMNTLIHLTNSTVFVQLHNVKQYDISSDSSSSDSSSNDSSSDDDDSDSGGGNGDNNNGGSNNGGSNNGGNEEEKTAPSTRKTEYYGFYPEVRKLATNRYSISKTLIYDVNTGMWHYFWRHSCSGCFLVLTFSSCASPFPLSFPVLPCPPLSKRSQRLRTVDNFSVSSWRFSIQ